MALATRGTIDPVRKFLSRASYSENLGGFRAALFLGRGQSLQLLVSAALPESE